MIEVMQYAGLNVPEHVITHKGCPRCSGTGKIRVRIGNRDGEDDCHYYGATYKVQARLLADLQMETANPV